MVGWWVAAGLLVAAAALLLINQRLRISLRHEHRNVRELQKELLATAGELSEVQTRRKRLLGASTQALIIVEKDYHVSSANKVAKEFFGPVDKKNSTLIEWTRRHKLLELVTQVLQGKKTVPLYLSIQDKILEAHARSIKVRGDIVAVALAISDVTELQNLSRARRDFVANISHELRTPLASIQLLIETLLSDAVLNDKKMARELIDKVAVQTETLGQLAQELMDLSLIESGQAPIKMGSYALRDIVQAQLERLTLQAKRKNIKLCLLVPPELKVLVDDKMIGRVIGNLVHNAIKFTDAGRVTIAAETITESALRDREKVREDWITVSVSDTGVGIPPDELPRIFERFYKIDRARNRKQAGTGLGLAIAKHIVEAHGGRIWALNNNGSGVTFYFNMPAEE